MGLHQGLDPTSSHDLVLVFFHTVQDWRQIRQGLKPFHLSNSQPQKHHFSHQTWTNWYVKNFSMTSGMLQHFLWWWKNCFKSVIQCVCWTIMPTSYMKDINCITTCACKLCDMQVNCQGGRKSCSQFLGEPVDRAGLCRLQSNLLMGMCERFKHTPTLPSCP